MLFRWTKKVFSIYAIDLNKNPNSWSLKSATKVACVRLVFLLGIALHVFKIAKSTSSLLIDGSMILSMIAVMTNHEIVARNHFKVRPFIALVLTILNEDEVRRIKNFDRLVNFCTTAFTVIEYAMLTVYNLYQGPFEGVLMMTGFKMTTHSRDTVTYICVQLLFASVSYRFLGLLISHIYFIIVQYTTLVYAGHCLETFQALQTSDKAMTVRGMKSAIKMIELYNEFKGVVNGSLGLIPFFLMACFFMHISSGAAHIILHSSSFRLVFVLLIMSTLLLYFLVTTVLMVEVASRANHKMMHSKNFLVKLLSSSLLDHRELYLNNLELERLKAGLLIYVTNIKVTPSMAFNMFTIDRSLMLKFTSAVIPLTVMIIETAIQMNISSNSFLVSPISATEQSTSGEM